ncbi:MAG: 2-phospho-L-lactate transferase [Actinobacteria bacterium]|nr:2-phospho-L-lactate transferase [Actinomycetota bacterium]
MQHPDEHRLRGQGSHHGPQVRPPQHLVPGGRRPHPRPAPDHEHLGGPVHLPPDGRQARPQPLRGLGHHHGGDGFERLGALGDGLGGHRPRHCGASVEQRQSSSPVVLLSGGVGGARLARGLVAAMPPDDLTVVVNVGDDEVVYGLDVSPDLDTVAYTLAGREGPQGWGLAGDTFAVMGHLAALGVDASFRVGDADLATNLARTAARRSGEALSAVTARLAASYGVACRLLPATDDLLRTRLCTPAGEWLSFQEYFVRRGHRDEVAALAYEGAASSRPAPGVLEAIAATSLVIVAPSNPPLSIGPILAVPGIREAVEDARRVVAVSPLFGGRALKGPADRVMASLGLPPGNAGVLAAYDGLLTDLVVDEGDAADRESLDAGGVRLHAADTRIAQPEAAARFARWLLGLP